MGSCFTSEDDPPTKEQPLEEEMITYANGDAYTGSNHECYQKLTQKASDTGSGSISTRTMIGTRETGSMIKNMEKVRFTTQMEKCTMDYGNI